jgi:hypothetical protein
MSPCTKPDKSDERDGSGSAPPTLRGCRQSRQAGPRPRDSFGNVGFTRAANKSTDHGDQVASIGPVEPRAARAATLQREVRPGAPSSGPSTARPQAAHLEINMQDNCSWDVPNRSAHAIVEKKECSQDAPSRSAAATPQATRAALAGREERRTGGSSVSRCQAARSATRRREECPQAVPSRLNTVGPQGDLPRLASRMNRLHASQSGSAISIPQATCSTAWCDKELLSLLIDSAATRLRNNRSAISPGSSSQSGTKSILEAVRRRRQNIRPDTGRDSPNARRSAKQQSSSLQVQNQVPVTTLTAFPDRVESRDLSELSAEAHVVGSADQSGTKGDRELSDFLDGCRVLGFAEVAPPMASDSRVMGYGTLDLISALKELEFLAPNLGPTSSRGGQPDSSVAPTGHQFFPPSLPGVGMLPSCEASLSRRPRPPGCKLGIGIETEFLLSSPRPATGEHTMGYLAGVVAWQHNSHVKDRHPRMLNEVYDLGRRSRFDSWRLTSDGSIQTEREPCELLPSRGILLA